jgi:aspartyl-tRNA(Asn)/glutamyl-tRNA(Gln) amidotransferase subunit C
MSLTQAEVEYVAQLARMRLPHAEVESLSAQLSAILDYMEMLQEVDVEGIEPTAQVTGLTSVMRPDEVAAMLSREVALNNAPAQQDGMFRVRPVFEE